jgi:prophage regulatory protein
MPDEHPKINSKVRLITKKQLLQRIPYTIQHIQRLEAQGRFPGRVQVGPNRVAWIESEIDEWLAARVAARKPVRGGSETPEKGQVA